MNSQVDFQAYYNSLDCVADYFVSIGTTEAAFSAPIDYDSPIEVKVLFQYPPFPKHEVPLPENIEEVTVT